MDKRKLALSALSVLALGGIFSFNTSTTFASYVLVEDTPKVEIEMLSGPGVLGTVTANNVNLRSAAGDSSPSLGQVHQGDRVRWIRTQLVGNTLWTQVAVESGNNNGRTGWIRSDFARF